MKIKTFRPPAHNGHVVALSSFGFLFIGQWLVSSTSAQQEVSYKVFASEMLQKGAVGKLVIINGEEVEVYIKPEFLGKATSNR